MIISQRPVRTTPRWMHGLVVLFALALLPPGIAQAQDVDAVGRRLREAVQQGEISAEQARAMMEALRKSSGTQEVERSRDEEQRRRKRAEYAEIEARIIEAVKAGKLSKEQAGKKLEAVKKELLGEPAEGERKEEPRRISREEYAKAEKEIKKAVENGRISPEDARARLGAMRRMIGEQGEEKRATEGQRKKRYLEIEARIIAAVRSGDLTKEEARKKLEAVKKELSGDHKKSDR